MNTFPDCGLEDGCCGPGCNSTNDADCIIGSICGNGVCDGFGEDCHTCPADCRCSGKNCSRGCCGDGLCLGNEKAKNCPVDCGG